MRQWLDRAMGPALSVGIHAALLLGASLAIFTTGGDYSGTLAAIGGPMASCIVRDPSPVFATIERRPDTSQASLPRPEPPGMYEEPRWSTAAAWDLEGSYDPVDFPGGYKIIYYDEGAVACATCLSEIVEQYGGRVKFVMIPRPPVFRPEADLYAFRAQSLANNRTGAPRLKSSTD